MTKKTIEDIKNDLNDRLRTIVREREKLIISASDKDKEITELMEKLLVLDNTKIRVYCLPPPMGCGGKGYYEDDKGNKRQCPVCGGPDKPYIWATKYIESD